ncbi:hypothetical protein [Heyndrickxia ginsengihumi]|uniref:hypothetical protein n=1 Tax=Heyndrickxia ginsengihumi TaxID=363870 RepID=UPI003D207547
MANIEIQSLNKDDLNKVVAALQADGYAVDLTESSTENYQITNDDGSVTNLEAYTYDVKKGDTLAGSLHQAVNGDIALTFALIDLSDNDQAYYSLNLNTGEVTKSTTEELTQGDTGAPIETESVITPESKYSTCKSVVNIVCRRSLKITLGACVEACLETGPGELVCTPLCYLMQWATCKLGASKICAPFK